MIKNKRLLFITTAVTLLPMAAGLMLWGRLPERMPTHWNSAGEIDGWGGRALAVFGIPGLLAAIHILCAVLTGLDPKSKDQTKKALGMVLWICPFISVVLGAVVYAVALGARINVASVVCASTGVLFVAVGNYMPKCKQNYTIGIKVMWALEDEGNWNATHRFAGKVWVVGGMVVILCSLFLSEALIWVYMCLASLMALLPVGYSYGYYKKSKKV